VGSQFRRLAACAGLALATACGGDRVEGLKGKNLLLISVDTLRADHTSPYGAATETPLLQRLASEGVVFENAYSPVPLTQPAHASLFTGSYPARHGVRDNVGFTLAERAVTLAECFAEAGYQTGAVVAASVLGKRSGLDQGFESYDDAFTAAQLGTGSPVVERVGEEVRDRALAWLDARDASRPFALFVHFYDPHAPYAAPGELGQRFSADPYAGEIAHADRCVAALVERLERENLLDATAVVFLSDHGESLGEHGEKTHGLFLYEAALHVPLVMRLPGADRPQGRRESAPVSLVDVMPTLVDLFELRAPPPMDGLSLRPLLEGGELAERSLFAETLYPLFYRWSPSFSIRQGQHKFIEAPRPELYDVVADPRELEDRLAAQPEVRAPLQGALQAELARWAALTPTAEQATSTDSVQALAALGYGAGMAVDPSTSGPLPDAKDRVEIYEELASAMSLVGERKLHQARKRFEAVLEKDPQNPSALLNLGDLLAQVGDFQGAIQKLEACLAVSPDNRMAKATLGVLYFSWGQIDKAQPLFEALIAESPRSAEPMFFLGQIHERRGETATALEWFRKAHELMPGIPGLEQKLRALEQAPAGG
jgi:arylsulfatase A-like enzyme/Tfp pilus assembly protein PilF